MHEIQERLLKLSKTRNLATMSLREMGREIKLPKESPQKIKHHLLQLQKKGFLVVDRTRGVMETADTKPSWANGILGSKSKVFSIPILGTANCGPATIFAEQNFQGFLKISSKLVHRRSPDGLYAVKTDGASMNRVDIDGKRIEDGDFAIIDSKDTSPDNNDPVLVIIENKATIKRFIDDRKNGQIVLKADSSFDYEPIFLHPSDDFTITGKVVGVFKNPS